MRNENQTTLAIEEQLAPALRAVPGSGEHIEEALGVHAAHPHRRGQIISRLISKDCRDLTDGELERCLKDCVCPAYLIRVSKGMRDAGILTPFDIIPNNKFSNAVNGPRSQDGAT